jgi:uncharacterized metal-binding protein YceD (DUF177 family)
VHIAADEAERAALAKRFGLNRLDRLEADYALAVMAGGWVATGTLSAEALQACVATGEDVPARIDAPFTIRFVPEGTLTSATPDEEVELDDDALDVMMVEDGRIDIGEAVAQTLALELDPFPRSPGADAYLREKGVVSDEEAGGTLAAGLRDLLGKS